MLIAGAGAIAMWVIANGAMKNGSTWLMQLVKSTKQFKKTPLQYQDPNWRNSSVRQDMVATAARTLTRKERRCLSKQHWADVNSHLLGVRGIRMMNIIRDARDTIVSRYHHDVRINKEDRSLEQFIEEHAARVLDDLCLYQRYWIDAAKSGGKRYLITSYEYLSFDLSAAARQVYEFIGVDAPAGETEKMAEKTSFENKDAGEGKFFRKGKAFGYSDEISAAQERRILDLCAARGLAAIKRDIAAFNPALGPYLEKTDVGL